jgi:hypothetical protein
MPCIHSLAKIKQRWPTEYSGILERKGGGVETAIDDLQV